MSFLNIFTRVFNRPSKPTKQSKPKATITPLTKVKQLELELDQERAQSKVLQSALIEALRVSQELNRQNSESLDRVITSKFDRPNVQHVFEQPQAATFAHSSLSDVLNMDMDDREFLNQE